ncbi:MAG: TetR/AcrR family transcriptional regulator [Akkermansia sp.]|nr:TetR/AcrR family transcriptional regulator [Akkermansia sp.]MDO4752483.1 TetR/AcrR family transcriptional regulator [Akkermansia sp.]
MNKSDATKAVIMRAAITLFTRLGYEGAAVRDIANAAGVTIGLIRYHFGHKADLYRDTLAYISEQYNRVCLGALQKARQNGSAEELIYSWLAAPITDWQDDTVAGGEEVLCFLNKMGYEAPELTREVYESHYSYALQEWQDALQAHFPGMERADWLWCMTCLRGMYFNIVAHNDFTLWGLPAIQGKEPAIRRLAADTVSLLNTYLR